MRTNMASERTERLCAKETPMKETPMKVAQTVMILLCVAGLAACGGGSAPGAGTAGQYVLDVDKTLAGAGRDVPESEAQAMREQFRPESYRVDLRADGTFTLEVEMGTESMRVNGSWGEEPGGSWIKTHTINGEEPEAGTTVMGTLEIEGDGIVLSEGDQRIYLHKQP